MRSYKEAHARPRGLSEEAPFATVTLTTHLYVPMKEATSKYIPQ